jgi:hypothetical protein
MLVLGFVTVTRSSVPLVRLFVTVKASWTFALPAVTDEGETVTP